MPLRKTHCIKRITYVYDIGSPFHPSHNSFLGRKHVTGFLGLAKKCPELRSISVLFILIDGGLFLCKAIYSSSGLIPSLRSRRMLYCLYCKNSCCLCACVQETDNFNDSCLLTFIYTSCIIKLPIAATLTHTLG